MKKMLLVGVSVAALTICAGPAPKGGPNAGGPKGGPAPKHQAAPAPAHHVAPAPHGGHPAGARFWARPAMPPPRHGAIKGWEWVAAAWNLTVGGVYYYGDGYYFDGRNYYYNGAYYTTPPAGVVVTTAPAPVVVTPAPPPPPPRRRGLLDILFGD